MLGLWPCPPAHTSADALTLALPRFLQSELQLSASDEPVHSGFTNILFNPSRPEAPSEMKCFLLYALPVNKPFPNAHF